jgi:putative two-component system protein, hydrogenase maturation factor HypX/HoxX
MRVDNLDTDHRPAAVALAPPAAPVATKLRVLFLVSAHNGLSQRVLIALEELGHDVTVAVVVTSAEMEAAVAAHEPELIVCPFLKRLIPESIWSKHRCLIVHPGPRGDRGPSSLDWAIELGASEWGVTVLEANGVADAGRVLAARTFAVRPDAGKSSLYRHEVRHAAVSALLEAIAAITRGARPPSVSGQASPGRARPLMSQQLRAIDWAADTTDTVLRKIRAGEGHPGVLDQIDGTEFHLFGAHREPNLRGRAGEIVAQRDGAICRATADGAVWITHLKRRETGDERFFKLPAVSAMTRAGIDPRVPEVPIAAAETPTDHPYQEIVVEERDGVCCVRFEFYNGAMSTEQCRRLREAFVQARSQRHASVIVLMGGTDYFSNGA